MAGISNQIQQKTEWNDSSMPWSQLNSISNSGVILEK